MTTPLSEINEIHASLTSTFLTSLSSTKSSPTKVPYPLLSLPYRQHQLLQLARLVQENADALCHSLWLDEGKPRQEVVMAEIGAVIGRALKGAKELESWVGGGAEIGEDVKLEGWQEAWKARVEKKAKGVVLIISYVPSLALSSLGELKLGEHRPWNYPIILTFQPLCGAIAAGCPALIKPSEVVPTFSKLLSELVPKYLDPAAYRVALGGVPEITKILELKCTCPSALHLYIHLSAPTSPPSIATSPHSLPSTSIPTPSSRPCIPNNDANLLVLLQGHTYSTQATAASPVSSPPPPRSISHR